MNKPAEHTQRTAFRPRNWLRFSLRSLLIVMTLVSLGLGLVVSRVQNERSAAAAITAAQGQIIYDWQVPPPNSGPNFRPEPPGPPWLRATLGPHWFARIVEVRLRGYGNPGGGNRLAVIGPHLEKLPALRSLTLWGPAIELDDYHLLGRLTQLTKLSLFLGAELRQPDAAALAANSGLRELHLLNAKISPPALLELAKLSNLERLDIECLAYDPNTGAQLEQYRLTDEAAAALATFPRLRSLSLFDTQITDAGMADLCRLSRLELLAVSSPQITSASFQQLAKLERLEHLGVWQWKIDPGHLPQLLQLPKLTGLTLNTPLDDESLPLLAEHDRLEGLTLSGAGITDAGLHHLGRLSKLKWLDLSDTSVVPSSAAAKELQGTLPNCTIILPRVKAKTANQAAAAMVAP